MKGELYIEKLTLETISKVLLSWIIFLKDEKKNIGFTSKKLRGVDMFLAIHLLMRIKTT